MVILDNHKTVPGWCCSNDDPDAFFGDPKFDPDLWMLGLKKMATIFMDVNNVIGMSLRNELRGYNHTAKDWYTYVINSIFFLYHNAHVKLKHQEIMHVN